MINMKSTSKYTYDRHYVDIYIKSQNRCIEVKSTWTFQMEHCYIFEKQTSAKLLGFDYEIWVF